MVDLIAAISSPLLVNEPQWVGIIVRPINYSLKGAILYIDTGPGLKIVDSHEIEMETYVDLLKSSVDMAHSVDAQNFERLCHSEGRIEFPDWASNETSILWIPIRAINERLARGSTTGLQ